MGRYYWGDIEGKFWFGVQPTSDLLEFGHDESESRLNVWIPFDDLQDIAEKLRTLKKAFRKHGITFQAFMTRLDKGSTKAKEAKTAKWQTMCREASLIELGEKILIELKKKKDDLYISGDY
ncbi:MAG: hypothetical protein A2283_11520 [Lentisphaerae bacterium RIFOXYA12_FULL_48_11]|nr:MAG: hypothetical protein A2283_11520 [Lentisphaerae bacterium RIFOXYA12_FULL_48_11]